MVGRDYVHGSSNLLGTQAHGPSAPVVRVFHLQPERSDAWFVALNQWIGFDKQNSESVEITPSRCSGFQPVATKWVRSILIGHFLGRACLFSAMKRQYKRLRQRATSSAL